MKVKTHKRNVTKATQELVLMNPLTWLSGIEQAAGQASLSNLTTLLCPCIAAQVVQCEGMDPRILNVPKNVWFKSGAYHAH